MGKLEEIPKKHFFQAPENYFDHLPVRIQKRIAAGEKTYFRKPAFRYALQYALPLLLLAAIIFYSSPVPNAESILASVETGDLIQYLQESGLTTEDVVENIQFTNAEVEAIENEVYYLDQDIKDFDLELNTGGYE